MKITLLTPGTGHFFCGSCLRDSALAKALRTLGHDVFIVPLYLPFMLEEEGVPARAEESPQVFLGGVNMYLQQKLPWLGKLPGWLKRPLDSPGLLRWLASRSDMTQAEDLGAMIVSTLRGDHGRQRAEVERLVEWLAGEERPDALILSNAMLLGLAGPLQQALQVPLFCTLQGEQPFLDTLAEPFLTDAWQALRERTSPVTRFIGVSGYYGELMADRLGIEASRLEVVYNGIDLEALGVALGFQSSASADRAPVIGYLARMCNDKGLETLVEAFCRLKPNAPTARLRIVGVMLKEDVPLVERCKERLRAAGFLQDASFHANVTREEKLAHLREFTVLSVPATYGESFGLYLPEAWAFGVPAVQPRHGAFPELIELTGAGLLCPPDDPGGLAQALEELLADPGRLAKLGAKARAAVEERFTVEHMAREIEAILAQHVRPQAAAAGGGGTAP